MQWHSKNNASTEINLLQVDNGKHKLSILVTHLIVMTVQLSIYTNNY